MAVYGIDPRRDNARLYRGVYRNSAADLPPQKCEESCGKEKQDVKSEKKQNALEGLVDEFFEGGADSDKLLIAALLYMLIKEGADIKLIIALGYILM